MAKKLKVPRVISKTDKNAVYNILNQCYKAGVRDAEYINDEARCKEFIAATRQPHVYGRVIYDNFFDWKRWRVAIITMQDSRIERDGCILLSNKILTPKSYFACLLPLAQCFYNQGLDDWNSNPTLHDFGIFNGRGMCRWTRKGIEKRSSKSMFVEIQRFAFDISSWSMDSDNKNALQSRQFDWFCREVWAQSLTEREKKGL